MMGNEISDHCFATKHVMTQCSPSSQSRDELAVNMIQKKKRKKHLRALSLSLSLSHTIDMYIRFGYFLLFISEGNIYYITII